MFPYEEKETKTLAESEFQWWRRGVLYQVYPRSYQDSNGDGIGDLPGITRRLEYIRSLGVDAIWISPIFVSPMVDFGYDVANYKDIDPVFGTIADFDTLLDRAHSIGLRVILDLVPNHTSDQHPWFVDSRSSRTAKKRDRYIWKEAKSDGSPPNNWLGAHGGGAWSWNVDTGQYYLHSYQPQMPDLNWANPAVREAIYDVMRFWLDRGVDGFRVDVILRLAKDPLFRDEPPNPSYRPGQDPEYDSLLHIYTRDVDGVHAYIREMRTVIDAYDERVLIGETNLPVRRLVRYYGSGNETHIPFNFGLITQPFEIDALTTHITEYIETLTEWNKSCQTPYRFTPNWVIGSHDRGRIASVERAGENRTAIAAMLLLTLPGFVTIYYGDEIGMDNGTFSPKEMLDNLGKNNANTALTRDRARTPMQWDPTRHAGFTVGTPWLPLNPDYQERNVVAQEHDAQSLLHFYRRLIAFRRANPGFTLGAIDVLTSMESVLVFRISEYLHVPKHETPVVSDGRKTVWTILLNLGEDRRTSCGWPTGKIAIATDRSREKADFDGSIAGYEGVIVVTPAEERD